MGAPLARKCWAFPKSFWWKHFPSPWIWDSDNCELQHGLGIPSTWNSSTAHAMPCLEAPPGCPILSWSLTATFSEVNGPSIDWIPHLHLFGIIQLFGSSINGFTSLARRSQNSNSLYWHWNIISLWFDTYRHLSLVPEMHLLILGGFGDTDWRRWKSQAITQGCWHHWVNNVLKQTSTSGKQCQYDLKPLEWAHCSYLLNVPRIKLIRKHKLLPSK